MIKLRKALEERGAKLDENQVPFIEALEQELESTLKARSLEMNEAVENKIKELNLPEDLAGQLRTLGEEIEKNGKPELHMNEFQKRNLRNTIKERHSEIVEAIKDRKALDLFELRVAAPHFNSNTTVSAGTNFGTQVAPALPLVENWKDDESIAFLRMPNNFILEVIRVNQVEKVPATLFKVEQASKEGDYAIVAEGAAKPLIQYKFVKNAIERFKAAGRIEWSEEFEYDNTRLFNAIVKMLERDIWGFVNSHVYSIMQANATAYTTSASTDTVIAPNATDVAVVLQGLIDCNGYTADTVAMNCGDVVNLMLLKAENGSYMLNPLFADGKINGMNVYSTSEVAKGKILVLDSSIYTLEHDRVKIRVGQYGNQFIENEYTLICEMFGLLDVAQIDLVASYYGDIDTIGADLEVEP